MISVSATIGKEHYRTELSYENVSFLADEDHENGGKGLGPNPSALLASALASCTAITLRMYADRKAFDVEKIEVRVELSTTALQGVTKALFMRTIKLLGAVAGEDRKRLLDIAEKCPTHKILSGEITIETTIE